MKITFSDLAVPTSGAVIAFATEGADLMPSAIALDEAIGGSITKAIKSSTFKGKAGQSLQILAPGQGDLTRVIVFGIGKEVFYNLLHDITGHGKAITTVGPGRTGNGRVDPHNLASQVQ